jgi:hypothetical protein
VGGNKRRVIVECRLLDSYPVSPIRPNWITPSVTHKAFVERHVTHCIRLTLLSTLLSALFIVTILLLAVDKAIFYSDYNPDFRVWYLTQV